ncbi:MAG: GTPase HflX [Sphaerochaetaceae bacterium]|nr:GTPase HflX [Sphaerochaetaceae bacterium]
MFETKVEKQKALLVIPNENDESEMRMHLRSEELESLVSTMGSLPLAILTFNIRKPNAATLFGKGQVEELKENVLFHEPDMVIFDTSLSPRILRNLEAELDICCIDREEVILQIFADRAQTREAVLQVSLARAEYSLPRLQRRWSNLSQQRGGVKGSRGAGERQLELDRRQLENQIVALKRELEEVKKTRDTQRSRRQSSSVYSFALVGYTNAGKSTLMNVLTGSDVLAENKLFATLDTTTRMISLCKNIKATISDTVGFVSNLPHHLVKAFSSTLEEACLANCLIIVCDGENPDMEMAYNTTNEVLSELGCGEKERIIVFNKIDTEGNDFALSRMRVSIPDHIEISARTKEGIPKLLERMREKVLSSLTRKTVELELTDTQALSKLYRLHRVLDVNYLDDKVVVTYIE